MKRPNTPGVPFGTNISPWFPVVFVAGCVGWMIILYIEFS